ncbi:hypothetical protein BAPKO_6020, partial (plasmid) [Borreliella afzelii PKo]|uniref:hypothetical protein n=1 Tax=Borreliella afzelii TaxID=29518 RepID=UPI0000DB938E
MKKLLKVNINNIFRYSEKLSLNEAGSYFYDLLIRNSTFLIKSYLMIFFTLILFCLFKMSLE